MKRLQTLPDAYRIVGARQVAIEQIGNSVPPQLGRMLALALRVSVFGGRDVVGVRVLDATESLGFRARKRQLTTVYKRKADDAHAARMSGPSISRLPGGNWTRFLTHDFALLSQPSRPATPLTFRASRRGRTWTLTASARGDLSSTAYEISIVPSDTAWCLNVDEVRLCGSAFDASVFTGLWKCFEEAARDAVGIADLVQLNGYYQYPPALKATVGAPGLPAGAFWRSLVSTTEGRGVGAILAPDQLARLWEVEHVPAVEVVECLLQLKRMGFEVRGHNTNPQIPEGRFLIPYAFPTLTPDSVQLRKQL